MPLWQIILLVSSLIFAVLCVLILIWNLWRAKKLRATDNALKNPKLNKYKPPVKLEKLIFMLGGIENIQGASASNNKLKILINDNKKVDLNSLKKIKHRGIFEQNNSISIILGSAATFLSNSINELIEHNKKN